MKKILMILFTLLMPAGAGTLLGFLRVEQKQVIFNKVCIDISYNTTDTLIEKQDVLQIINSESGNICHKSFDQVNIRQIIDKLKENPFVADCDAEAVLNGTLRIRVKQNTPMLRIIVGEFSCYLDSAGYVMPINEPYSARVPVASGNLFPESILKPGNNIREMAASNPMVSKGSVFEVFKLAKFIFSDERIKPLVDQIYVNEQDELELFSKFGSHIILLGQANDMEHKFNNLLAFYQEGVPKYGWSAFRQINLKYKNQVVCLKK